MRFLFIFASLVMLSIASTADAAIFRRSKMDTKVKAFIRILAEVETGNKNVAGDGGKAIGPLQIWYPYWKDAGMPGSYNDCQRYEYAEAVVYAYWQRYCPAAIKAHDWQTLARIHNAGPNGDERKASLPYWEKVQRAMRVAKFN